MSLPSNTLAWSPRIDSIRISISPQLAVTSSRATQAFATASAVGHIALNTARADIDFAGVTRIPVRGNGGLLGELKVGLTLIDQIFLGFSFGRVDDGLLLTLV